MIASTAYASGLSTSAALAHASSGAAPSRATVAFARHRTTAAAETEGQADKEQTEMEPHGLDREQLLDQCGGPHAVRGCRAEHLRNLINGTGFLISAPRRYDRQQPERMPPIDDWFRQRPTERTALR